MNNVKNFFFLLNDKDYSIKTQTDIELTYLYIYLKKKKSSHLKRWLHGPSNFFFPKFILSLNNKFEHLFFFFDTIILQGVKSFIETVIF